MISPSTDPGPRVINMNMNQRLTAMVETHPALGWLTSFLSFLAGVFGWAIDHVDDFSKVFGLVATIFGVIAGWYTIRIQRRAWQRGEAADRQGR